MVPGVPLPDPTSFVLGFNNTLSLPSLTRLLITNYLSFFFGRIGLWVRAVTRLSGDEAGSGAFVGFFPNLSASLVLLCLPLFEFSGFKWGIFWVVIWELNFCAIPAAERWFLFVIPELKFVIWFL